MAFMDDNYAPSDIEEQDLTPHSIEAEQALLGALLYDNEIYHRIRTLADEGKSLLVMCDTLEEDIGLSNRMLIMKDGRLENEVICPADSKPAPIDIIASIV